VRNVILSAAKNLGWWGVPLPRCFVAEFILSLAEGLKNNKPGESFSNDERDLA
jgi:hypothetical protein